MRSRYDCFLPSVQILCRRIKEEAFVTIWRGYFIPTVQLCDKISLAKYKTISTPSYIALYFEWKSRWI